MRFLERILRGIHSEIPLAVLFGGMDRRKRDGHILFAHSEEPADRNDEGIDLAALVDQHIGDLASLCVRGVVDILLVVVRDCRRVRRQCVQNLCLHRGADPCRRLLRISSARYGRCDRGGDGEFVQHCSAPSSWFIGRKGRNPNLPRGKRVQIRFVPSFCCTFCRTGFPDGDHHTLAFFPTCLGGRCLSFSISSGVSCSIPTKELRASLTRISSSIFACSAAL